MNNPTIFLNQLAAFLDKWGVTMRCETEPFSTKARVIFVFDGEQVSIESYGCGLFSNVRHSVEVYAAEKPNKE